MSNVTSPQNSVTAHSWKRYPKYRNSGVEWMEEVPEGWDIKRLKFTAELINKRADESQKDLHYIGLENIESWTGQYIPCEENHEIESESSHFNRGDVLFGKLRPYLAKVLKATDEGICTSELLILHPKTVSQTFLSLFLLSQNFINTVDSSTYGTKMPRANWAFIGNLGCPNPPFPEQTAITTFLDRETARIDALIAKKERQIELLLEKRAALISHAVTKGLNPKVKTKDSGLEWIGEVPEHWELIKNKWIYQEIDERSITGGEELLTVSHITGVTPRSEKDVNMFLPLSFEGYKLCKKGDLAINTMWAFMGALGFSPCDGIVSPSYNIYRLKKRYVSKYFDYLYRTPAFICEIFRYSKGVWTSRLRLYPEEFFSMTSMIPTVNEQKMIVEHIDSIIESEKVQIGKIQQSIALLKEYRSALISAAVTGKIDVRGEVNA